MRFKYFLLLLSIITVNTFLVYKIEKNKDKVLNYEEQLLINQASTHFDDQEKIRLWNAQYGGVYVYPKDSQKPNPHLIDNKIYDKENKELIKINPAWMTRQLSKLENSGYSFRITSLNPLNPQNKANNFEKKALRYILDKNVSSYYEFDKEKNSFKYMGALITTQDCLKCHRKQGYKVGDVHGGISIELDNLEHFKNKERIIKNHLLQQAAVIVFSIIVLFLLYKIIQYGEKYKNGKKTIDNYFKIIDEHLIVCYTDTDGIITNVSHAFSKITGYKKEDCINKSNSFLMSSDTPQWFYDELWDHIENGLEWHGELKFKKANGEYFWVSLKTSPIYNDNSTLLGYMIVYYDLTDLKYQEKIK